MSMYCTKDKDKGMNSASVKPLRPDSNLQRSPTVHLVQGLLEVFQCEDVGDLRIAAKPGALDNNRDPMLIVSSG